MALTGQTLQFQPFQSAVDLSFWAEFTKLKLHNLKLSEEAIDVEGFWGMSNFTELPTPFQLDEQSLSPGSASPKVRVIASGQLQNFNTLAGFKAADRDALMRHSAAKLWQNIKSGEAEKYPALLVSFLLLSHAELKSYKFFYWFAFPALRPPNPFLLLSRTNLEAVLDNDGCHKLAEATEHMLAASTSQEPFWLIENLQTPSLHPLTSWSKLQGRDVSLGMVDASNLTDYPSWPLRNMLLLAAARWRIDSIRVVCWRSRGGRLNPERTLVLTVGLPKLPEGWSLDTQPVPAAVGWEANLKQKVGPRLANMGASMDPQRLAESAADLNVRLMKWRAAPALDVDRLAATKCLLLGAGTLGCAVARTLLGWGVRHISLLDSSRVSYSNPVRQSLYEFQDCLAGGAPKAAAAAAKLQAIFPMVVTQGVEITIPMPGHAVDPTEHSGVKSSVEQLEELIKSHDVVFLLMDTRESRWLPTLLCAVHNKLAINAALGFDSYLVMRHGRGPHSDLPGGKADASRLGCYFCNDVIAPLDSTVDRTLDQQCTVARPGLAPIAGALAVELMAAVIDHPDGVAAAAGGAVSQAGSSSAIVSAKGDLPLGSAPHMIRGHLNSFTQNSLTGQAFSQCTACSSAVVKEYVQTGWPWLLEVLQDPKKLEDLTGLTELMQKASEYALESDNDPDEEEETDFVEL